MATNGKTYFKDDNSIIDLIMESEIIKYSGVLDINCSDHLPISMSYKKVMVKVHRFYRTRQLREHILLIYSWDKYHVL